MLNIAVKHEEKRKMQRRFMDSEGGHADGWCDIRVMTTHGLMLVFVVVVVCCLFSHFPRKIISPEIRDGFLPGRVSPPRRPFFICLGRLYRLYRLLQLFLVYATLFVFLLIINILCEVKNTSVYLSCTAIGIPLILHL